MGKFTGFAVSVGDVLYRAETHVFPAGFGEFGVFSESRLKVDVLVNRYEVVRVTDASYFVVDPKYRGLRPMRRSRTAFHLWARKTEEEALEHLKRRSVSRMGHALQRLEEARAVLLKFGLTENGDTT